VSRREGERRANVFGLGYLPDDKKKKRRGAPVSSFHLFRGEKKKGKKKLGTLKKRETASPDSRRGKKKSTKCWTISLIYRARKKGEKGEKKEGR